MITHKGWKHPVYPEKGHCRIRKKANGLAQIGWKIIGWATSSKCVVVFGVTREHLELDTSLVEVQDEQAG